MQEQDFETECYRNIIDFIKNKGSDVVIFKNMLETCKRMPDSNKDYQVLISTAVIIAMCNNHMDILKYLIDIENVDITFLEQIESKWTSENNVMSNYIKSKIAEKKLKKSIPIAKNNNSKEIII